MGEKVRKKLDINTLKRSDILEVIPKHCFVKSTPYSLYQLFRIVAMMCACWYIFESLGPTLPPMNSVEDFSVANVAQISLWVMVWTLYAICQGTITVGYRHLVHECQHHLFTSYNFLSDLTGYILDSLAMIPYFGHQYSHVRHHQSTGHLMEDIIFIPMVNKVTSPRKYKTVSKFAKHEHGVDGFIWLHMLGSFFLGFPRFVCCFSARRNLVGRRMYSSLKSSQYFYGDIFEGSNVPRWKVEISTVGCIATFMGLCYWAYERGIIEVLRVYGGPYIVMMAWTIAYTFMAHRDSRHRERLPGYGDDEWTKMKGILSTVDRSYGWLDFFHLHALSHHLVHHVSPKIPCFHANEATVYVKEYLGDLYVENTEDPWYTAIYKTYRDCIFVESLGGAQVIKGVVDVKKEIDKYPKANIVQ